MMQHLKYIFPFLLLMLGVALNSGTYAAGLPADTLHQKKVNGIRVKPYKVQSKDTWSSISKKSKVSVAFLMTVNAGVDNLKTGQIINIPLEESSSVKEVAEVPEAQPVTAPVKESRYQEPVYHTIKKGETLYGVSKHFNQPVANIRKWNDLTGNDIKIGQKLIVNYTYRYKKEKEPAVKETEAVVTTKVTGNERQDAPVKSDKAISKDAKETVVSPTVKATPASDKLIASTEKTSSYGEEKITEGLSKTPASRIIRPVTETGVASWIMDGDINQNKYYALHRNAPVGTIVKVTNRMNGKYVFVKVVGLLPDTGDNENVIIKISQAASNKINVLDSRFQAELSYGIAE
jgi:LysM repeat protein